MTSRIGHVEVLSEDPAPLRGFYDVVFGWKVHLTGDGDPEDTEYAMGTVDPEANLTFGVGRRPSNQLPVTFYVRVDDLQATLDAVSAQGGRTVTPPLQVGPGTVIARFADPAGNVIGLAKD